MTNSGDAELHAYYALGKERDRLARGSGLLEYLRTCEIVLRDLPESPSVVADIGGGPGRYALWLAGRGHTVEHRDLMQSHVAQVAATAHGRVRSAVGDARDLDLPDASVDAVLLLGPLYHLRQRADRIRALSQARRIVRPGGPVFAAVISRWGLRLDGILAHRIYLQYPHITGLCDTIERTGDMPPLSPGGFGGYCHRPAQFRAELRAAGLTVTSLVSVEGGGALMPDIEQRMDDPADRAAVLDTARALERVPELLGIGPHLLATTRRPR
jgi:SAM-dependent methyltransferase